MDKLDDTLKPGDLALRCQGCQKVIFVPGWTEMLLCGTKVVMVEKGEKVQ